MCLQGTHQLFRRPTDSGGNQSYGIRSRLDAHLFYVPAAEIVSFGDVRVVSSAETDFRDVANTPGDPFARLVFAMNVS